MTLIGPLAVSPGLPGGILAALNVTAAGAIKASAGILVRISVLIAGTAGNLTVNDTATSGGVATANQVFNALYSALTPGTPVLLDWPCATGIYVSAVPTGAQIAISFS